MVRIEIKLLDHTELSIEDKKDSVLLLIVNKTVIKQLEI
jgi:hypothetical protein